MKALAAWLPWIVGLILALVVFRFVAGIALRLLSLVVLIAVAYFVWQAISRRF